MYGAGKLNIPHKTFAMANQNNTEFPTKLHKAVADFRGLFGGINNIESFVYVQVSGKQHLRNNVTFIEIKEEEKDIFKERI